MNVLRPIQAQDLEVLCEIARQSGPGFTSLPDNPELLERKLQAALSAVEKKLSHPKGESYLFVLENLQQGRVVGVCGIESAVGLQDPWYHYRIGTLVHASRELNVHNQFRTLYLCNDYTGCSEVCSLYLLPEFRRNGAGSLLSKARFLFMAEFPERFSDRVIAEMRGVSNEQGRSPFWDGLGRQFFSMEFSEADYLTGIGNKQFIAELMPKHALYIHLLPRAAQAVIGEVHRGTVPARRLLEQEGFHYEGYVDIFDGGPTLVGSLQELRSVRHSRYVKVRIGTSDTEGAPTLISNTRLQAFRCALLALNLADPNSVSLSRPQARALGVAEGDTVRVVPLSATRR